MLSSKTVFFGDRPITLHGFPDDPYFTAVNLDDGADQLFVQALRRLPPDAVTVDIGANIGLTGAMAAQHASRVYCFEPSPRTFQALEQTIRGNGLQDRVETVNMALGRQDGVLSFFDDPTSGSASHLITGATLGRQSSADVRVTTLDGFAAEKSLDRLDFIKIDIEGFEIDALAGAADTIRRLRPSALIEFNAFTMVGFRNLNPRDLLALIRASFPYVYRWKGRAERITGDGEALSFIHDNLVSAGCVDDLFGTFEPID